ncbi:MAG: pentapeptide repeat-containing protein, partial [Pseudomonadota bacterium]
MSNQATEDETEAAPPVWDAATSAAFRNELRALNPWAAPYIDRIETLEGAGTWDVGDEILGSVQARSGEARDLFEDLKYAIRDTALQRMAGGAAQWNAWAEPMEILGQRAKAGKTAASDDHMIWRLIAHTQLFDLSFVRDCKFSKFVFPDAATFDVAFGDKETSPINVWLNEARFGGDAWFNGARFGGTAGFDQARFGGTAGFYGARFGGTAGFTGARFGDIALFNGARFGGDDPSAPAGSAYFQRTEWTRDANFNQCQINCQLTFASAMFREAASFQSLVSRVGLSFADASFAQVPDLTDAAFHVPPRLDNVRISEQQTVTSGHGTATREPRERLPAAVLRLTRRLAHADHSESEARFRALRKAAIEAQDHERELAFFAAEVKARRFWTDQPWGRRVHLLVERGEYGRVERAVDALTYAATDVQPPPGLDEDDPPDRIVAKHIRSAGMGRFWFGLAYEWVSDFGRSLFRPLVAWAALICVFTALYASLHTEPA